MPLLHFICVIAYLTTCALGYDDDSISWQLNNKNQVTASWGNVKTHTISPEVAEMAATAYMTTIIVVLVLYLIFFLFGVCMIAIFGRKKVIPGQILSAPQMNQQINPDSGVGFGQPLTTMYSPIHPPPSQQPE